MFWTFIQKTQNFETSAKAQKIEKNQILWKMLEFNCVLVTLKPSSMNIYKDIMQIVRPTCEQSGRSPFNLRTSLQFRETERMKE